MKIDIRELIAQRDLAKESYNKHTERLQKMTDMHCPEPILVNEQRWIDKMKERYAMLCLAIKCYKRGVCDGLRDDLSGLQILQDELSPSERLIKAIFGETSEDALNTETESPDDDASN